MLELELVPDLDSSLEMAALAFMDFGQLRTLWVELLQTNRGSAQTYISAPPPSVFHLSQVSLQHQASCLAWLWACPFFYYTLQPFHWGRVPGLGPCCQCALDLDCPSRHRVWIGMPVLSGSPCGLPNIIDQSLGQDPRGDPSSWACHSGPSHP